VIVGATLPAWRNPKIAKIPRMSPAITIATPAHRAIVARVHQPYAFSSIARSDSPLNRMSAFACRSAATFGSSPSARAAPLVSEYVAPSLTAARCPAM
jgi:hypothetical protein